MKIELDIQSFETLDGVTRDYVTLRAYESLEGDYTALKKDVTELRSNRALLTSEVEEIAKIRAEHRAMMDRENELALFLREHYKDEIALGQHGGMTLVQVVQRYLGRERMYARDQIGRMVPEPMTAKVAKVKSRRNTQ